MPVTFKKISMATNSASRTSHLVSRFRVFIFNYLLLPLLSRRMQRNFEGAGAPALPYVHYTGFSPAMQEEGKIKQSFRKPLQPGANPI